MSIEKLRRNWDRFGKTDPLWAILTTPGKRGRRWQLDEFFHTGDEEIAMIMKYMDSLGAGPDRSRALDFGCGVGRLTQALASHFGEVCGVDIAPSMIRLAKKYNRQGKRCAFYLNDRADLKIFGAGTFTFIYSSITLQHMEPEYCEAYLKEFLRILAPGGFLVFNLPSEQAPIPESSSEPAKGAREQIPSPEAGRLARSVAPPGLLSLYCRWKYPEPPKMEMHAIRRENVEKILQENGAQIVNVIRRDVAGPEWIGYRYCARKEQFPSSQPSES